MASSRGAVLYGRQTGVCAANTGLRGRERRRCRMDFERRAKKAYDRGESVRAVVVLVEGIKNHSDRDEALRKLMDYYTDGVESPGLERDVAAALAEHPQGDRLASRVDERLEASGREAMARDFRRAAADRGLKVTRFEGREDVGKENERRSAREPAARSAPVPSESGGSEAGRGEAREQGQRARDGERRSDLDGAEQGEVVDGSPSSAAGGGLISAVRGRSVAALAVAGAAIAVFAVWSSYWRQGGDAESRLGEYLRGADPTRGGALREFETWANREGIPEAEMREGRAFLRAVRALEAGETHRAPSDPTTAWGYSAGAMSALSKGDLREGVRLESKLERRYRSKKIVRQWTSGRVAEYRGSLSRARRLYERCRTGAGEFVPCVTGGLRVAYAQFDADEVRRLLDRLSSIRGSHPYLRLGRIRLPRTGLPRFAGDRTETKKPPGEADGPGESEFLSLLETYAAARDAAANRRFERAARLAGNVADQRSHFGPALWVGAVADLARFELERADRRLEQIVDLPGLARTYRWYLVAVAPEMFTGAARPDLGAKYVLPGFGALPTAPESGAGDRPGRDGSPDAEIGRAEVGSEGPVVPRTAHWTYDRSNAPVSRSVVEAAYLVRLRVTLEIGRHEAVRRMLEELPEVRARRRTLELFRAEFAARRGRRPAGPEEWRWERARPEERLVDAYHSGRFDSAIEVGEDLSREVQAAGRVVRMVALSYAATDRGRRALRMLSRAETSVRATPRKRRVRARILSRLGGTGTGSDDIFEAFRRVAPTSVEAATDLAAGGIWGHRLEASKRWSKIAVRRAPDHPESNWVRGLVLRMDGARRESEPFFRRSWRARGTRPRLSLELGYVHLAADRYRRARDLFFRALLADPESLEAIRGLGRAYLGFDASRGEWNMERILENYESDEESAVHAAEVLRWLAVFRGSRSGKEAGFQALEEARTLGGERPSTLLEFARYYEARGRMEEARDAYMEALEKDATLAPAHLGLAKIAGRRDNTRGKRTHLRRYLDLQPEGADADWAREELRAIRENDVEGSD